MSDIKKKKRSRSKSREDHHSKRRHDEKFDNLQKQLDNLTKMVETLANSQKENSQSLPAKNIRIDEENKDNNNPDLDESEEELLENSEPETLNNSALEILGIDPNDSKFKKVKYHPELKNTWLKWKNEGLPEKNKKQILELYNRKGEFYTEAPNLNLEISPLLSEIAKKRDQHFMETQNCVGTAIAALGAAVSMLIEHPEDGLDKNSVARKSFITPQLNKSVKPMVDTMFSNEWLYGDNLKDKVKDVKEIEKACANIKDKPPQKYIPRAREQGNWKYPPAGYRQVGQHQRRRQIKFKTRSYRTSQSSTKLTPQTTNQLSLKK
ncbi:uncharacterized protein LOC128895832 [Hylaeus anthracinus]|uniref:uncharacterized protein LOC128895832 n=1 Tax=Hylaeus anthracinus TaxID=313031 RepID=UPI0023B8F334|nr:uncharacterized protein LOC128895832 [Hylaeus anthracinus]